MNRAEPILQRMEAIDSTLGILGPRRNLVYETLFGQAERGQREELIEERRQLQREYDRLPVSAKP